MNILRNALNVRLVLISMFFENSPLDVFGAPICYRMGEGCVSSVIRSSGILCGSAQV